MNIKKTIDTKKWYESKMIWLGIASIMVSVIEALQSGADWKAAVLAGFGTLAIILRTVTEKGITK